MKNYLSLPYIFHRKHDLCMSLINQIEEFIINDEYKELRVQKVTFEEETSKHGEENALDFLLRAGKRKEHDQIVKMNVINGLLGDICYFVQEALACSLKQRLTVSFALLRKPFVFDLIVILRLLFEEGFIDRFNNKVGFDPAMISAEDRKKLIDVSLQSIGNTPFTTNDIIEWIFDKVSPDSLINLSDKALHLSTTRNPNNRTEVQNFNFIFSTKEATNSQWEYLYNRLPALLFYLVQVIDILVFDSINIDSDLYIKRLTNRASFMKDGLLDN